MPRVSLDGDTAPDRSPRPRTAAANAFAAALADGDVSDREALTPPTAIHEDTWREQSSADSDSEYESPPGPASSQPSLRDASLDTTRARKPDSFARVAGGVGSVARGVWSATLIGPFVARNVFLLDPKDDASSSEGEEEDDAGDGLHGEIRRARLRQRDASRDDARVSVRTAEAAAAEAMRSVFDVAARAARAVSPFASGSAQPGRKTLRPNAGASDRRRQGDFAEDGGSSRGGTSAGDSDELMYNHGVGVAGDVSETDVSDEEWDEERGGFGEAYGTCGAANATPSPRR